MAQFLQRVLTTACFCVLAANSGSSSRFLSDDPLLREPKPLPVGKIVPSKFSDAGDFLRDTFRLPGEKQSKSASTPSLDINTLDELPDSAWYTNRHYFHRMSVDQLRRGVDGTHSPAIDKPWKVYQAKIDGVTPGFRIQDSRGEKYVVKFDPVGNIEMATGADVVSARFLHAFGYNVPDNYPIHFRREQIQLGEKVKFNRHGHMVMMDEEDLDSLLAKAPRYPDGTYRGVASRLIAGEPVGPFQYYGTRPDDPNDTIPHERRRVLRGLYIFAAWLDHTDSRAINSLDSIQEVDGVRAVRHYLIDFGATLGSDSLIPKEVWHGHEYYIDMKRAVVAFTTLGIYAPGWAKSGLHQPPAVGRFDADTFEADKWKASYPNPAFENRTVQDCFWAARQVAALSDDEIRAVVSAGEYSQKSAADEIARVLIVRRDRIAHYYLPLVLPLDAFRIEGGELKFRELIAGGRYSIAWAHFNNNSGQTSPITGQGTFRLPADSGFLRAEISGGDRKTLVYLHDGKVVGVER